MSDIIPAGSLAKSFTATAIMRAIDAGVKAPTGEGGKGGVWTPSHALERERLRFNRFRARMLSVLLA